MASTQTARQLQVRLDSTHSTRGATDKIIICRDGEASVAQELAVTFQRTVRAAVNGETKDAPPSLGTFPIYPTTDYSEIPPSQIVGKKSFFLPMYRKSSSTSDDINMMLIEQSEREAMWINFESKQPFAVKIVCASYRGLRHSYKLSG
jgi:hypothetical protein